MVRTRFFYNDPLYDQGNRVCIVGRKKNRTEIESLAQIEDASLRSCFLGKKDCLFIFFKLLLLSRKLRRLSDLGPIEGRQLRSLISSVECEGCAVMEHHPLSTRRRRHMKIKLHFTTIRTLYICYSGKKSRHSALKFDMTGMTVRLLHRIFS